MPTGIEWTDETWNPVTGCTKVSSGCKHCYAKHQAWPRLSSMPNTVYTGREFEDVRCHAERLVQPVRWTRQRRIFVNSMSDLFHEDVPDEFIDSVFGVMWACLWGRDEQPGHIFQVLTKRPQRMRDYLSQDRREHWARAAVSHGGGMDPDGIYDQVMDAEGPHPRIWLGVSVEDQVAAEERIPLLLQSPAAVRWVSAEPLLERVDLTSIRLSGGDFDALRGGDVGRSVRNEHWPSLDWVVVGGESGPNARPMHPDWAKCLRDQCAAAGVPFLFKQWGEWADAEDFPSEVQEDYDARGLTESMCIRVGKRTAGRLLDGMQHDGYPTTQGPTS